MKFCFILTQDLESPSGLGRYYPWGNELNKLGHEVEIIALHGNFNDLKKKSQNLNENFHVKYVSQMHVRKIGNTKLYFSIINLLWIILMATFRLTINALKSNADVYIVGKPHPMNGIAGLFCKLFLSGKLIIDCDDDETNSGNFGNNWQKKIIQFFELTIPKFADLVTTNTKYSKERIIRSGIKGNRIFFLSNGVDPQRFNNIDYEKLNKMRNDLGLMNKKIIAYIGSMSLANHSVDLLIDVFERLVMIDKNFALILVGGGEDFQKLENHVLHIGISPFVQFVGRIDPNEVKYYYKMADLTVDPIKDDVAAKARSPLKIFESWVCGVPIISLPIGDRSKLIVDSENGFLIDDFYFFPDFIVKNFDIKIRNNPKINDNCILHAKKYYWNNLIKAFEREIFMG